METTAPRTTHPLIVIAAIAVTLFSLTGIAALMGWLPTSSGTNAPSTSHPLVSDASTAVAPAPAAQPAPRVEAPAKRKSEASPAARVSRPAPSASTEPASSPAPTAPTQVAAVEPPSAPAPVIAAAEPPRPVCRECGVVDAIRPIEKQEAPSGVGAAAGGVLGGIVGHQVGAGRGRDIATVVGAVGGAIAGHQVEKARRTTTVYEISVRFDDGTSQRFTQTERPALYQGQRVRLVNGVLRADA